MHRLRALLVSVALGAHASAFASEGFYFRNTNPSLPKTVGGASGSGTGTPTPDQNSVPATPATPTLTIDPSSISIAEGTAGTAKATSNVKNATWSLSGLPSGGNGSVAADGTVTVYGQDVTMASSFTLTVTATDPLTSKPMSAQLGLGITPSTADAGPAVPVRSGKAFQTPVSTTAAYAGTWTITASGGATGTGFAQGGSKATTLSGTAPVNAGAAMVSAKTDIAFVASSAPSGATPAMATASAGLNVYPTLAFATAPAGVTGVAKTAIPANAPPSVNGKVATGTGITYALMSGSTNVSGTLGSTAALCSGLAFSTSSGVITGTPAGACTLSLTYMVTDTGSGTSIPTSSASSDAFGLTVTDPPATGHRYYRMSNIQAWDNTSANLDNAWSVFELAYYDPAGGAAPISVGTQSNPYSLSSYPTKNFFDASNSTLGAGRNGDTFTVDLGASGAKVIKTAKLFSREDSPYGHYQNQFPATFDWQYSDDNVTWRSLGTVNLKAQITTLAAQTLYTITLPTN